MESRDHVTVVIPVRDGGLFLAEQLTALAGQRFDGTWDVLVSDNGSSDGTADLVESFRDHLPLELLDSSARPGPAGARNAGAEAARGSWIAFCDADDVVDPDWLRNLVRRAATDVLVAGALEHDRLNRPDLSGLRGRLFSRELASPMGFLPFALSGNMLVHRDLLLRLGGFREDYAYCEDVELSWRAQLQGARVVFAPDAVVHYRHRSGALAALRQTYRYNVAEARLFCDFAPVGARRDGGRGGLRRSGWLLTRSPYVLAGSARRTVYATVLGEAAGRVRGSVRERVVYL